MYTNAEVEEHRKRMEAGEFCSFIYCHLPKGHEGLHSDGFEGIECWPGYVEGKRVPCVNPEHEHAVSGNIEGGLQRDPWGLKEIPLDDWENESE